MIEELYNTINPKQIVYEDFCFESYAIIEGAKVPMLYSDLEEGVLEYDILFLEEKLREKLVTRGPFLVKLDFETQVGSEQSKELLKECYGKNAMLLFATPMLFDATLQKVREIFYLKDNEGNSEGIIRFYEPRIFSELMNEYDSTLYHLFFYNIYGYWCEDTKMIEQLLSYNYTSKGVNSKTIQLDNSKGA
jgi:hypothetical protein